MGRRIRRTILLLSLVICVICIGFWIRSHFRRDAVVTRWPANGLAIQSGYGIVRVYLRTTDLGPGVQTNVWRVDAVRGPFTYEDDPFQTGTWSFTTLIFQPPPSFEWEHVQGAPASSGGLSITSGGGTIMLSGSAGARPTVGDAYLRISFPYWLPVCLFGLLPFAAGARFTVTHWRRYRRLLAGTCPLCAYDLRATPGKCPECGWTMHAAHDASAKPASAAATTQATS